MQAIPAGAPRIDPPTVVVHGASDLHRVLDAARAAGLGRLHLLSAPDAACFLGPAWWRGLMRNAAALVDGTGPALRDVLDCGDAAGRALEAMRLGQRLLVLEPTSQWRTVRERADAVGAVLLATRPPALDLAGVGADRRLAAWLGGGDAVADDTARRPG